MNCSTLYTYYFQYNTMFSVDFNAYLMINLHSGFDAPPYRQSHSCMHQIRWFVDQIETSYNFCVFVLKTVEMADCSQVANSEDYKRVLDDNDLTSWYFRIVMVSRNRIVCNIEGMSTIVVDSAGEGGYDECIKHLDPKKVRFYLSFRWDFSCIVPIRFDWSCRSRKQVCCCE